MPDLVIEQLTHARLLDAWPIIRSTGAYARSDWWLADADCLIDDGGGVLAASPADGVIHGIATYRMRQDSSLGKVLSIQSIVTFELRGTAPVKRALCDALDELSLMLECDALEMKDGFQPNAHPGS